MFIEAIVKGISLENMGAHLESIFVLTLEVLGSNGTELKIPVDREHAMKYQLGQTVGYSIEAMEEEIQKNKGPEAYDRREKTAAEEEMEKMINEYAGDDDNEVNYAEDDDYEAGATVEAVLADKSDEMSDEEIAEKVGRNEQSISDPMMAPKVENTEIKNLTESEYRGQEVEQTPSEKTSHSETANTEAVDEQMTEATEQAPKEEKTEDTTAESETAAPIGMMGGYPGDTEDVYDEDDE